MFMNSRPCQLVCQVAEVIHIILPEYVTAQVSQIAWAPHIVEKSHSSKFIDSAGLGLVPALSSLFRPG